MTSVSPAASPARPLGKASPKAPWFDRAGRLSPVKLVVFILLFVPGAWTLIQWWQGDLAPKPVTEAIHQTGDWALRFLLLSLLITPLRRLADWPKVIAVRRMVGLAAAAYAAAHLVLYATDQKWKLWTVVSEIVLRFYLTIGFVALLGLLVLSATSTDGMIRRLGGTAWNRLHTLVYAIAVLALLHYFLQTKLDVTQATLFAGLFLLLMGHRLMLKLGWKSEPLPLLVLAVLATAATMGVEYLWYALATGVSPMRVFLANFDFSYVIRPAWWVGVVGLAFALVQFLAPRRAALLRPFGVHLAPADGRGRTR